MMFRADSPRKIEPSKDSAAFCAEFSQSPEFSSEQSESDFARIISELHSNMFLSSAFSAFGESSADLADSFGSSALNRADSESDSFGIKADDA